MNHSFKHSVLHNVLELLSGYWITKKCLIMIKLNNNCSLLNNEQHKTRPFLIDLNTADV